MELKDLRDKIDKIDEEIMGLISKRMSIVKKIAGIKEKKKIAIFQGGREMEVRKNNISSAKKLGIREKFARQITALIIDESKKIQEDISGKVDIK